MGGWGPEMSLQPPTPLCQPCEAVTLDVNPSPSHTPVALTATGQPWAKCEPEAPHQAGAGTPSHRNGEREELFLVLSHSCWLGSNR